MTRPAFIAIEGVIGVGKTTLARLLQADYDADLVLEVFEENPFLPLFYQEPERYAFQAQIVFLLSRYRQQRVLAERVGSQPLLSDYLFAKDRLFARLNLDGDEWETYARLHEALAERIAQPDLVVYLRAGVDTLMARITQRDRPYERGMARDYIARLTQRYEQFFARYTATPLVTVDTDDLNVLTREADLARVRGRVREAVEQGRFQQRLPLPDNLLVAPTPLPPVVPPTVLPALPAPDALLAYLRLHEEASGLAGALRHPSEPGSVPEALHRLQARLQELAGTLGVALHKGEGGR